MKALIYFPGRPACFRKNVSLKHHAFFCIFLVTALCSNAQYQDIRFEQLKGDEHLADRSINAIVQDSTGFIWIGSEDGLTRYDGYNFILYRHINNVSNSLPDNEIKCLLADANNMLWVGTRNGLCKFDTKNMVFTNYHHDETNNNSPASNEVFSLAKDNLSDIWLGTYGGGLDRMHVTSDKVAFKHYSKAQETGNGILDNRVYSLYVDKKNTCYAGTERGLHILRSNASTFQYIVHKTGSDSSIHSNGIFKIFVDAGKNIWVCGRSMLDRITLNEPALLPHVQHVLPLVTGSPNVADWNINNFIIDREGNCWMATNDQGLFRFSFSDGRVSNIQQFDAYAAERNQLSNTQVYSIFEDRSGVVWFGTDQGLFRYIPANNRFAITVLPGTNGQDYQCAPAALFIDKSNNFWLGCDSLRLLSDAASPGEKKLFDSKKLPLTISGIDQVNTVFQSSQGDVYIGTLANGIHIIPASSLVAWNKNNWKNIQQSSYKSLVSNNIYCITEDAGGNIWLGTYLGICKYDPRSDTMLPVYTSQNGIGSSDHIIRDVLAVSNSTILAGSDNGLLEITNGKLSKIFYNEAGNKHSISDNRINFIKKDKENRIWIGTRQGLNLYNISTKTFDRYLLDEDIPDASAVSMLEDSTHQFWIGTNRGLLQFDPTTGKYRYFGSKDGLVSDAFFRNAAAADAAGNFYFSTIGGIISFKPTDFKPNSYIPPVVITNIKVLDEDIVFLKDSSVLKQYRQSNKLVLQYNQNFFSFEFAALNYINTSSNQYAYMLEGVDPRWNFTGTRNYVRYTDIKPGHYRFLVKASNNDGAWNNTPLTLDVIIVPAWWQTWWFYIGCTLLLGAIIYFIYRIRLKQVLEVYRLRSNIAKDLHDDVGSALSSIALLSKIAQEGKAETKLDSTEIFSRIGNTSHRMIDLMNDIVWSVNPDNDRFSNMLVRMREHIVEMLEPLNIDFSFRIAESVQDIKIPMQVRKDYFLIFKEAIHNIAKYSEASFVQVTIERTRNNLVTTIKDNGKGFDVNKVAGKGNGLRNMQQRAAAIKCIFEIHSVAEAGTTITLQFSVP